METFRLEKHLFKWECRVLRPLKSADTYTDVKTELFNKGAAQI